jgi:O-antigen/teichoic acid export membrane protein
MLAVIQILRSKSFSSLVGNGLGAILGMLTFALLARILPKDAFGPYIVFLAIYGIFETLRIGMVMNAMVRNLSQCSNEAEEKKVIGSTLLITLLITLMYMVLMAILYFLFKSLGLFLDYIFFFKWLVALAVLTLPNNYTTWYLNAKLRIISMSSIRIISQLLFIAYIWVFVKADPSIYNVLNGYLISQGIISLVCVLMGWSGFQYLFQYTQKVVLDIFHFGKYSMGTLLGSNLLRSSDTFIIGSSILGSGGVAIFNVPSRILEVVEMPLRSFAVTALPQFAKQFADKNYEALRFEFEKKAGMVFFLLLPIAIICFVFADWVVLLIGGTGYSESANILRFFASYMAILPLDKFSGVMLDTINKPHLNFYKVGIQLFVNIVGDYLAILIFGNLESVALVSTLTFIAGMIFGYYQLNKHMGIEFKNVLVYGWIEFSGHILKILKLKKHEA